MWERGWGGEGGQVHFDFTEGGKKFIMYVEVVLGLWQNHFQQPDNLRNQTS